MGESLALALNSVVGSKTSYLYKVGKNDEMKNKVFLSINYVFFIVVPSMFGICAITKSFVPIFFGQGYDKFITLIQLMRPLILIISISGCLSNILLIPIEKRSQANLAIICVLITNILLNSVLIFILDSIGAVISSIVAELVVIILHFYISGNMMNLKEIFLFLYKYFIARIIMIFVIYISLLYLIKDKFLMKYTHIFLNKIIKTSNMTFFILYKICKTFLNL